MRLLLPLLTAACSAGSDEPADTDTASRPPADTAPGADTDVDASCAGTVTITFEDMPEAISEPGSDWEIDGLRMVAQTTLGEDLLVVRGDDDCLEARAGSVRIEWSNSGCGGSRARFAVQSLCGATGAGCTEVIAATWKDGIVSGNSTGSKNEVVLEVAPRDGFSLLGFASLDGRLCSIEVDRIPLTDALAPEDTGDPF